MSEIPQPNPDDMQFSMADSQPEVNPNELRKQMDNAIQFGTTADLEALFDGGMSVDQEDWQGRTALMMSSATGKKDAVEMLLQRGANINYLYKHQNRIPQSALDAARQTGNNEIADILMGLGAKTGREIEEELKTQE